MPNASDRNLRDRPTTIKTRSGVVPKATTVTSDINSKARTSTGKLPNTSRLSTAASSSLSSASKINLQDKIKDLEGRLASLESTVSVIIAENSELKHLINNLQSDLSNSTELISQIQLQRTDLPLQVEQTVSTEVTAEQDTLNANIVIRGLEVTETTSESDLRSIYEGLRNHLGVSNIAEFDPVGVSVIESSTAARKASYRPILVKFTSAESKRKFLQVRRVKKDIFISDIGIDSNSRRPVLVSEQLTQANQELLYQARALRGDNGFKFVWSSNGQILVRSKPHAKVIRITDIAHINRLKTAINSHQQDE